MYQTIRRSGRALVYLSNRLSVSSAVHAPSRRMHADVTAESVESHSYIRYAVMASSDMIGGALFSSCTDLSVTVIG